MRTDIPTLTYIGTIHRMHTELFVLYCMLFSVTVAYFSLLNHTPCSILSCLKNAIFVVL